MTEANSAVANRTESARLPIPFSTTRYNGQPSQITSRPVAYFSHWLTLVDV